MANAFYNYSGNFIPGTLARAETVSSEFSSVATGFAKLSIQGVDTGTLNHVVFATTGYPVAAYADGNNLQFRVLLTNTGPTDINVNGIGAVPLLRFNGTPLVAGDISAGSWYIAIYEAAFGGFTILSPAAYATFAGTISQAAPSNKVGLVAAAGSSTAAAPIDVTFAIDQAIVPTWSGLHTFTGKVVISAPASGFALAVTSTSSGTAAISATGSGAGTSVVAIVDTANGNGANLLLTGNGGTTPSKFIRVNAGVFQILNSGYTAALLSIADAGNVTIPAPSSGVALSVTGVAGSSAAQFLTTGVQIGSPTGGDKGSGTLNVASNLYINNVAVTAGTTVSSITGTANQITASAATGAVTLSLPSAIILSTAGSSITLADATHTGTVSAGNTLLQGDGTSGYCRTTNAGTMFFGANNTNYWQISSAGGLSNGTVPTGGDAITVSTIAGTWSTFNGANSSTGSGLRVVGNFTGAGTTQLVQFSDANNTNGVNLQLTGNGSNPNKYLRAASGNFEIINSGYSATIFKVSDAGNTTINAPSSGVALSVTGVAGSSAAQFLTTGVQIGSPTGGDKGSGTINVAGNFYLNGTALSTGVSSITGTANQIAASASTGAVTLSMPVNVIIPTPVSGIALAVTGVSGGSSAMTVTGAGAGAALAVTGGTGQAVNITSTAVASAVFTTTNQSQAALQADSTHANGALLALSNSGTIFGGLESGKANAISAVLGDFAITAVTNNLILATGTTAKLTITSTGGVIIGAATDQGVGTLAALTQLYVGTVPMYRTGTFTATITGMTAGTTATCTYAISGTTATVQFPIASTGTSNTTAMTFTGLPAVLQPATLRSLAICLVEDGGNNVVGAADVTNGSGTVTFLREIAATGVLSATGFTNSGVKGLNGTTFTYSLL